MKTTAPEDYLMKNFDLRSASKPLSILSTKVNWGAISLYSEKAFDEERTSKQDALRLTD
ncbi:MAG: hypothetical protein IPN13_21120 [Bacteroidetes bacterium]|nr:hypothetical protein [Bacteroidota bacterium]